MRQRSVFLFCRRGSCSVALLLVGLASSATLTAARYEWRGGGQVEDPESWSPSARFDPAAVDEYWMSHARKGRLSAPLELPASSFVVGQNDRSEGAQLTLKRSGRLRVGAFSVAVGKSISKPSTVALESGCSIETGAANIGLQSDGWLEIDPGAEFIAGGDVRLGSGPDAVGTITNRGDYHQAHQLYFAEHGGQAKFVHAKGATSRMRVAQLALNPEHPDRSAVLELIGSGGGGFYLSNSGIGGGAALQAGHPSAVLRWVFDADGVTPITLTGPAGIAALEAATLELDLDALASAGTYPLIQLQRRGEIQASGVQVAFLGERTGDVAIDESTGDLVVHVSDLPAAPDSGASALTRQNK
ncbi:MAG: hypothetical protein ACPGIC_07205 [Opitutales bacterium]